MGKKLKNTTLISQKGLSIRHFDEDGYELTHPDDIKEWKSRNRKRDKARWIKKEKEGNYNLSRWGQEVVSILIENGEMKNVDIMVELRNRGCTLGATHIKAFFKSIDGKRFYQEQLVGNQGYWSLKD